MEVRKTLNFKTTLIGGISMTTMKCDMCEQEFSAESFEEWFKQMQEHYMKDHKDFMEQAKNKTKEEGMKWMAEMKAKFDAL